MSSADTLSPLSAAFQLKGSMLAITVLELSDNDLHKLEQQLIAKVAQAPSFFGNTPLIIALDKLPVYAREIDIPALMDICARHGLITLGIRADLPSHLNLAKQLNLPVLPPSGARERKIALPEPAPAPEPVAPPPAVASELQRRPTRIITTPVRSGQQIYAQDGDLVVLSAVSPGAELLADGNIHVYGPLRGRVLAGAKGDEKARIFCFQMAAELVSIAGRYKVNEDLRREPQWGKATQISLDGDVLNITQL